MSLHVTEDEETNEVQNLDEMPLKGGSLRLLLCNCDINLFLGN